MNKKGLLLIVFVFTLQISYTQTIEVNPDNINFLRQWAELMIAKREYYKSTVKPQMVECGNTTYGSKERQVAEAKLWPLNAQIQEMAIRAHDLKNKAFSGPFCKTPFKFPRFNSKSEIKTYLASLEKTIFDLHPKNPDESFRFKFGHQMTELRRYCFRQIKSELNNNLDKYMGEGAVNTEDNSNLEAEFLTEISKINADIAVINRLAQRKDIVESLGSAQILCDKLRKYQGDQYFSRTLKKIRKENPGFSFSITPLAEEITREYWIRMRNRANLAYRNAMDAYKGCVWNEGIQQAGVVEIPYAYAKLTFDLVNMWGDMCSKKLFGTLQNIYKAYKNPSESLRPIMLISEDILAGGNDAYDWKTYAGLVGGAISGWDNFWKAWSMVEQQGVQGKLIKANRESAKRLIKSGKNLLQQFDKYRAFIDSHSSSIDCLRDKIMRIDLDNQSIKGDKVQVWGTGLYDYDPDKYLSMIKEAGEDLKNEYIYCEDFIKSLQIAVHIATTDYYMIEEKVRNSGADKTQIDAQLSHNSQNGDWFDDESTRLSEYYIQFCDKPDNNIPEDVKVVSVKVIPGVEDQGGNPNDPPVWEYEDEEDYELTNEPEYDELEQNNNNNNNSTTGGNSASGMISKGNGWSAQKIENNPAAIQNDINNAINSGKTPAGIYVSSGTEVVVYYIEGNPLGMTAWNLENYNDATSLQNGITSYINQAYFPMGISFTDQGKLYVLFIKSQVIATDWQLVESQLDLNVVSTNMQPWLDQQYVPVGITIYNGMYYTLMTKIPDTKISNWTIEGYQDNINEIKQNVNAKINSGLLPFGFLKEGELVNVLYVGF